ncbi:MAG: CHASE domain-containing protein [Nitrospinae bacterium]|nr:CHASE domain-containing protein [Nitrospinota bacterium]
MANKIIFSKAAIILLFSLSIGCYFIYSFESSREIEARSMATQIASSHAQSLEKQLFRSLSATLALATILKENSQFPNFNSVAKDLIKRYGGISNLQLAPNAIIQKIYPLEGNEPAIGLDLMQYPKAVSAIEKKQLTVEGPLNLVQGGIAIIGRYPVFLPDEKTGVEKFWGFTTALIKLSQLLKLVDIHGLVSQNFYYQLASIVPETGEKKNFAKSGEVDLINPVSVEIKISNEKWILSISPKSGWHSYLIWEGILVLAISGLLSFLGYRHFFREQELKDANLKMTQEINQRRLAEKRVMVFAESLQANNRELESFASIASHDLQEPLRKVIIFGDLLLEKAKNLDSKSKDYVERMQKASGRMQVFIDDLLAFSKIAQNLTFKNVQTDKLLKEVIEDLEARISETAGIIVYRDIPNLEADPVQMKQLFQNLLSNALKYHREGIPPVVNAYGKTLENDMVHIFFEDNGIGFEEIYREQIFQPFRRLHGRNAYGGTGMGLAICKKIIERHKGKILVTSTPNQGSIFQVVLPIKQSE